MKTQKEIEEYLKDKWLNNHTGWLIEGYLKAKNICNSIPEIYSLNNQKIDCSFKDFLEWFESETKEDSQDLITFEGKQYKFVENGGCLDCDMNSNNCLQECIPSNRKDAKDGHFELIVIQEKAQPKELELIPKEFYYIQKGKYKFIIQLKKLVKKEILPCFYYYMFKSHDNELKKDFYCENANWRLATPEEKQMLITAVERKENKLWNEETKMFEDKPKDILVPENIKITDCKTDGYTLGLLFNNDIQILTYGKKSKAYLIGIKGLNAKYIQCKLIPTLFADIKAGDIYIECGLNQLNPSCYHIKLQGKEYVKIDGKKDIQVSTDSPDKNQNVYKVVPII